MLCVHPTVLFCAAAAGAVVNVTCQAPEGGWTSAPNITLTGYTTTKGCPETTAFAVIPKTTAVFNLQGGPDGRGSVPHVCPGDASVTWNYSATVNNVSSAEFSAEKDGVTCTPSSITIGEAS